MENVFCATAQPHFLHFFEGSKRRMLKAPGLILSVLHILVPLFNYWSYYVQISP